MGLNSKELDNLYTTMQSKRTAIAENERYVIGNNPAILDKKAGKSPDNRIPTPLAKSGVEDMTGYAGRAGDVKTSYELVEVKEEVNEVVDPFIDYMNAMDIYNKVDLENSELYEEALNQGESYELWWTSDRKNLPGGLLTAEYKIVPNAEILLIHSTDLKQELLSAIHFTEQTDMITADIYYPEFKETWIRKKDSDVWIKSTFEKETENGVVLLDQSKYPYKIVPVNVFKSNRRSLPYFNAEKSLIDAHDEVLSKSLNEIDRFNAMIMLFGKKVSKELAKKLNDSEISILDELGEEVTHWPEYLQKEFGGIKEFYSDLMDRFERLFHKSTKVPDMTSETFAGSDQSGIAIAFKLMGMEFKAAQIQTYFSQGLDRRLQLYSDLFNASTASVDIMDYKAVITAKRNIPIDTKAKAEILQLLTGKISMESAIKFLPKELIPDPEKELELLKGEQPAGTVDFDDETIITGTDPVEAVKLSGIQIKAANDIITLVGKPLDAGGITRDAGLNQLKIFLGLTDAQANQVMGNKQTGTAKSKAE
ncbi:phage portal protein [bacterium]|nr:phage portal protein [bacterium]